MFKSIYNFFTEKNYYFIIFEVKKERLMKEKYEEPILDKQVLKWAKRYFFFKLSQIEYMEFLSLKENGTFMVLGNCPNDGKTINKNVYLFMVELVNELKSKGQYKVTNDYPFERILKFGNEIKIYKVKKYKYKK